MSVITAIVLVVITFSDQTPVSPEIVSAPVIPPNSAVLVKDDSVKVEQNQEAVVSKSLETDNDSLERVNDIHRRNAMYASWTKDRIEAYAVYELDSLELVRIGITVLPDGSIFRVVDARPSSRFTITMKEQPDR